MRNGQAVVILGALAMAVCAVLVDAPTWLIGICAAVAMLWSL